MFLLRVNSSIADSSAAMPGTLVITSCWASRCQKPVAWSMAAPVLPARSGVHSNEMNPSSPRPCSYAGLSRRAAADVVEREREEQLPRVTLPARDQLARLAVVAVGFGPHGPPPGRARFTVSPARLAACMGCSPPPADSAPPLVASVQGTRRLRSCLSLCPAARRTADSRIRRWLAIHGPWCLVLAKEHVKNEFRVDTALTGRRYSVGIVRVPADFPGVGRCRA